MGKKTSRGSKDTPEQMEHSSETLSSLRSDSTVHGEGSALGGQKIRLVGNCVFRIGGKREAKKLIFLRGFEPSPEVAAGLQAAFHRFFRDGRSGGRLETADFSGDFSASQRYLNHLDGIAKDFFSSEHSSPPQPFGKYRFRIVPLGSEELELLESTSINNERVGNTTAFSRELGESCIQELEGSPVLIQAFSSILDLRRLANQPGTPVAILKQVHRTLYGLRTAVGKLLSEIFNRWAGQQWESFDESQTIASQMDAAAANLRLKFRIVDTSGEPRIASLRCNRTGTNKKPGFQYESYEDGKHVIHRSSRFLLKTRLKPAANDSRRRDG